MQNTASATSEAWFWSDLIVGGALGDDLSAWSVYRPMLLLPNHNARHALNVRAEAFPFDSLGPSKLTTVHNKPCMKELLRSEDSRPCEAAERSVRRKYVRDQSILSDEIVSLLDMHGELTCGRIARLVGADNRLVHQVLLEMAHDGRVKGMQRMGSRGQSHCFWSTLSTPSRRPIQFNGASILSAFQKSVAVPG